MSTDNRYHLLDALIAQDACFAIYRLPEERSPRFVMQSSGTVSLFHDIEALNEQSGFVIAPFRITDGSPLLVIRPDCTDLNEVDISVIGSSPRELPTKRFHNIDKAAYDRLFQQFHTPLLNGGIKKLVLSRSMTMAREEASHQGAPSSGLLRNIPIPLSTCFILLKAVPGWVVHPRYSSPAPGVNGKRWPWPAHVTPIREISRGTTRTCASSTWLPPTS